MKDLLLMRHAKSSWSNAALSDFDRPLNGRGKADAPRMGELLQRLGLVPDLVLTSPANRACTTAQRVVAAAGDRSELRENLQLYGGGVNAYRKAIHELSDSLACVMLVGHNPDIEEALEAITGEYATMPTATIAHIQLPAWKAIRNGDARLMDVYRPKELD